MTPDEVFDKYMFEVFKYLDFQHWSRAAVDENFMRKIEELIGIPVEFIDDFRRQIMAFKGMFDLRLQELTWKSNPKLAVGIAAYAGVSYVQPPARRRIDDPFEPSMVTYE